MKLTFTTLLVTMSGILASAAPAPNQAAVASADEMVVEPRAEPGTALQMEKRVPKDKNAPGSGTSLVNIFYCMFGRRDKCQWQ
ncbi:hypothetical protein Tdes44962_MAKER00491 [Teratosphaeria destructans]|uniref:Uncharacterized protein n=1 Tax=Teratosphaeria destructans TaxID=418781 RepID=A0A9W7SQ67_9PEZI|nr:hypothetical protein Tdes44962_MAKER00491 [Teratosphaeria destructans]